MIQVTQTYRETKGEVPLMRRNVAQEAGIWRGDAVYSNSPARLNGSCQLMPSLRRDMLGQRNTDGVKG